LDKVFEHKDWTTYRFACDCRTPSHSMDIHVEIIPDEKYPYYSFYFETKYRDFSQRIKDAFNILFKGWICDHDYCLKQDEVDNLKSILTPQIKESNEEMIDNIVKEYERREEENK
jgi:hypothetical protein